MNSITSCNFAVEHEPAARPMKRISALLLLILFLAYSSSSGLFFHTHIINGVVVVHSHFYLLKGSTQDAPTKTGGAAQHRHSTAELALIDLLSNWNTEQLLPGVEIPSVAPRLIDVIRPVDSTLSLLTQIPTLFLRGPPVS